MRLSLSLKKTMSRNTKNDCSLLCQNLGAVKIGGVAKIAKLDCSGPVLDRLARLGFTPGSSIIVLHSYYNNMIVKLDNMKLAISESIAKHIMVFCDEA